MTGNTPGRALISYSCLCAVYAHQPITETATYSDTKRVSDSSNVRCSSLHGGGTETPQRQPCGWQTSDAALASATASGPAGSPPAAMLYAVASLRNEMRSALSCGFFSPANTCASGSTHLQRPRTPMVSKWDNRTTLKCVCQ